YGRYLERQGLARGGDHMLAGLLLNACEIARYLPAGKLGKGSVELTRLEERIERVLTAARRAARRTERRSALWQKPGRSPAALWDKPTPPADEDEQEQAGDEPAGVEDDAAEGGDA